MISVCEQLQRYALAKLLAKRLNLIERRQSIAGTLQEQHRDLNVEQMRGALLDGRPAGCSGNPRKASPQTPCSGAFSCACDVIRPPKDLPPAMRGVSGSRHSAAPTAARTVACASRGGSGRLAPRSI